MAFLRELDISNQTYEEPNPLSHFTAFVTDISHLSPLNVVLPVNDITGSNLVFLGSTTAGSGVNQFNTPSPIFASSDGHIYVADTTNDRVVRIDDISGAGWTALGSHGSGVRQFEGPLGVFVVP